MRVVVGIEPSLVFENPLKVWAPRSLKDALAALSAVDEALDSGCYVAGALSYEFGALLHDIPCRAQNVPLLVLGAFREPLRRRLPRERARFSMAAPLSRVDRTAYESNIAHVLAQIRDGEVYQVNYTVPFDVGFSGDPLDLYSFLARRARARYSAYVEHEDVSLVSLSPELFLRFEGSRVTTKPMKGTAPLGNIDELANEKNRAEHVMIVDLLRNDFHRICNDVRVERLYDVERYPTFATMTSTITGTLRAASFEAILRAAFPCGSVTGAPKRAAMRQITALEREARGYYTGSVGFLTPKRRGWWNVAIRTLQFANHPLTARFDAGGGIVSDSNPQGEWEEVLLKSRFLSPAYESFSIWETLRTGQPSNNTAAHIQRLTTSAQTFGLKVDLERLLATLEDLEKREHAQLVRIRVSATVMHIASERIEETREPVRVCLASARVRSDDAFLAHKTAWRPAHTSAALEAQARGCFDALLRNERDELTEGARTNVFVRYGETLFTPPLASGALPGILRARLIEDGSAVERALFVEDLVNADAVYVGNSARGLLLADLTGVRQRA